MSHEAPYRPRRAAAADQPDDESAKDVTDGGRVFRGDDPDATLIITPRRAAASSDDTGTPDLDESDLDESDLDDEDLTSGAHGRRARAAEDPDHDPAPAAAPATSAAPATPAAPASAEAAMPPSHSPWSRAAALRHGGNAPRHGEGHTSRKDATAKGARATAKHGSAPTNQEGTAAQVTLQTDPPSSQDAAGTGKPAGAQAAPSQTPPSPSRPSPSRPSPSRPSGRGRRRAATGHRMPVVAASIVTVLAVILGLGYVGISFLGDGQPVIPFGSTSTPPPTSARPTVPPVSVDRLLTPEQVQHLNPDAAWDIARSQEGRDEQSPVAVCLNRPGADDVVAETSALRTLTTSSGPAMSLLHDSALYADGEQATQVLSTLARQIGGCTTSGAFLARAQSVDGLGNQALAAQIRVTPAAQEAEAQFHTVLVVRTGRVINIVDVVADGGFVDTVAAAETLIPILNQQCGAAGGFCAQRPTVSTMVPPIGSDNPGLPVLADVPPLPKMTGRWTASDPTENPDPLPEFSGCERITSSNAKVASTVHRAYLVQDDDTIPATYGWDLVVFSMADAGEAGTLVKDVKASINGCESRQRSAEVSDADSFTGVGAQKIQIDATTWTIRQATGENDDSFIDYRVALVQADNKVAYVFLPLVAGEVNFTKADWEALAIRVGQRATQVA